MSILDIFKQDAFSLTRLTDAMAEVAYVPGVISSLGIFQVDSIDTLNFSIERMPEENIVLMPSSPRGGPGQTRDFVKRNMRMLTLAHYQRDDGISADEVQQVRAFGTENAVESFQTKIARRAAVHSQDLALLEERNRLEVLKTGRILDADGSVLFDFFAEFNETQNAVIDFDLDNASPASGALRKKCAEVTRLMASLLGGLPFSGITAICGDRFMDDLVSNPEVVDTYRGYEAAATLRTAYINGGGNGIYGSFQFGGIEWINYRSSSLSSVDTNACHLFPRGVPGLFRTVYGPADYVDAVNRPGQRMYAKTWPWPNDKGVALEFQSNQVHYANRPRVLIPGRRT